MKTILLEGNHMSISSDIRNLLDIQDANIIFAENCVKEGIRKGKTFKYVTGKLTYEPICCKNCGIKNEDYIISKNGTQISRITLPTTGIYPTYLHLKKQRFLCRECDSSFTAKTPIVKKNCYISEHTNAQVVIKSAEAQPLISIARDIAVNDESRLQRIREHITKTYH